MDRTREAAAPHQASLFDPITAAPAPTTVLDRRAPATREAHHPGAERPSAARSTPPAPALPSPSTIVPVARDDRPGPATGGRHLYAIDPRAISGKDLYGVALQTERFLVFDEVFRTGGIPEPTAPRYTIARKDLLTDAVPRTLEHTRWAQEDRLRYVEVASCTAWPEVMQFMNHRATPETRKTFQDPDAGHAHGPAAYRLLEQQAATVGWPQSYKTDLTVHDRMLLERGGARTPAAFGWTLRDTGTDLVDPRFDPLRDSWATAIATDRATAAVRQFYLVENAKFLPGPNGGIRQTPESWLNGLQTMRAAAIQKTPHQVHPGSRHRASAPLEMPSA